MPLFDLLGLVPEALGGQYVIQGPRLERGDENQRLAGRQPPDGRHDFWKRLHAAAQVVSYIQHQWFHQTRTSDRLSETASTASCRRPARPPAPSERGTGRRARPSPATTTCRPSRHGHRRRPPKTAAE